MAHDSLGPYALRVSSDFAQLVRCTRKHRQWWNYVVLQDSTRAELYLNAPAAEENKALFDVLHAERERIEAEFGGELSWQRLDDKRAFRISFAVPGGWVDNQSWPTAIDQGVAAMQRLYEALSPRVKAAQAGTREAASGPSK